MKSLSVPCLRDSAAARLLKRQATWWLLDLMLLELFPTLQIPLL